MTKERHAPTGTPLDSLWPTIPEEFRRGLFLPSTYRVGSEALTMDDGAVITTTPVIPIATIHDLDLGEYHLDVIILDHGQWRRVTLPRQDLLDRRRVLRLGNLGVDVASGSEQRLIRFFQDYLRFNLLPLRRRTGRLGFHQVVDEQLICVLSQVLGGSGNFVFSTDNEETRARHAALKPRGTLAGWIASIERVVEFPIVIFTMLVALVPALRELLRLPMKSCLFYLLERSSTGKTAAQEIGCSVWAQPGDAWIKSAHGTYAGLESLLLPTCGLPTFLEDAHLLPEETLKLLVYAVTNEHFKARGGDRRRPQAHWRGVVIGSGELPIIHGASLSGEAARVITVRGMPFQEQSPERGKFVNEIIAGVRTNSGHLGPAVVERLLGASAAERVALAQEWEQTTRAYATAAGERVLLGRQAPHYAAAVVAARLVAELTGLPLARLVAAVERVFELAKTQIVALPPARRAAELLVSEMESQEKACVVWDPVEAKYRPHVGIRQVGVLNEKEGFAAIFPSIAHDILRRHGLMVHQVMETMREQKLLRPDRKTGFTAQIWFLGQRPRMLRLPYPLPDDEEVGGRGDEEDAQ